MKFDKVYFYHNCYQSRNMIDQFAVVNKSPDNTPRIDVSCNTFFNSRSAKKQLMMHIFYQSLYFFNIKGQVCIWANMAHQAGAYPGFCSMKRQGVFLLSPGWDASPSQGYPEH